MKLEGRQQKEAKFNVKEEICAKRKILHPRRGNIYIMTTKPSRAVSNTTSDRKNRIYLDWIRQASYVRTLFRKELGNMLWSRTLIESHNHEDMSPLLQFLQE
jgi:hypothetical protein